MVLIKSNSEIRKVETVTINIDEINEIEEIKKSRKPMKPYKSMK